MQHTAPNGPVQISLHISDREVCGDIKGYGRNMGAVSLCSQSRCLKRAIVTVCPYEALSPPGIQQVFLNLVYIQEKKRSKGSRPGAGNRPASLMKRNFFPPTNLGHSSS